MDIVGYVTKRFGGISAVPQPHVNVRDGLLVGYSVFCVYDVLNKRVMLDDVDKIYLTRSVLARLDEADKRTRFRLSGIKAPNYRMFESIHDESLYAHQMTARRMSESDESDSELMALYDQIAEMWYNGVIHARPQEWGPVGKAYWTRDNKPVVMPWGDERKTPSPTLI